MAGIPISITKIFIKDSNPYKDQNKPSFLLKLHDKNSNWNLTYCSSLEELMKLKKEIDNLVNELSIAEVIGCNSEQAKDIEHHYTNDALCKDCTYKKTSTCKTCLFELQSPLERILYLRLKKEYIQFQIQYPLDLSGNNINIEGKSYSNVHNNFKDVLTIVDFYLHKGNTTVCVYTDGHNYHERTPEQAQRDRNIDRKLQEFGFIVLRYTTKDVQENIEKIISDIRKWIL